MVPLIFAIISGILGMVLAVPVEYYATKYEHIDVEMILNNRRIVNYYSACLLNKGPCPPEGVELKRILPESLKTNCARCTEKQKIYTMRVIKRLKKEYPKIWAQLEQQWDPEGKYVQRFEEKLANEIADVKPEPSVQILNRFGDDDNENSISPISNTDTSKITTVSRKSIPIPSSSINTFTSTNKPSIISTQKISSTKKITSTVKHAIEPSSTTVKTTRSPGFSTKIPVVPFRPIANIGAGIEATVSLGTDILGSVVEGLGALGTKVFETGADIADVVLKNLGKTL